MDLSLGGLSLRPGGAGGGLRPGGAFAAFALGSRPKEASASSATGGGGGDGGDVTKYDRAFLMAFQEVRPSGEGLRCRAAAHTLGPVSPPAPAALHRPAR